MRNELAPHAPDRADRSRSSPMSWRQDRAFREVGEVYRDDPAFDVTRLVAELVEGDFVLCPLSFFLCWKAHARPVRRGFRAP